MDNVLIICTLYLLLTNFTNVIILSYSRKIQKIYVTNTVYCLIGSLIGNIDIDYMRMVF